MKELQDRQVDLIVMAGYMRIITNVLVEPLFWAHDQHSSVTAAVVSRRSCDRASRRVRREANRRDRSLRGRRAGLRADHRPARR